MNKYKRRAVIYIILSSLFFAVMNLCVKMSGDIQPIQKSFFRNLIAFICAFFMMLKTKTSFRAPKGSFKFLLLRAIAGTVGIFGNFLALESISLADASLLNKLSPIFSLIFSYLLLKEKISLKQGLCILVSFAGLIFVVRPGFNDVEIVPYLYAIMGGFGAGVAYVMIRVMNRYDVPGPLIVCFFSGFSMLAAIPFFIFSPSPMSLLQIVWLVAAGVFAACAQFAITAGYKLAPARDISIYEYIQIIFGAVLDLVFLNILPDYISFIGYVIIILAAVYNTFGRDITIRKKGEEH